MASSGLNKAQRSALVICARELGIDPSTLQDRNPFALDTPRSLSLQGKMRAMFPRLTQELIEAAEVPLSLGAAALLDGEDVPMTKALAVELATNRPERWAEMEAQRSQQRTAAFEEQMAAQREAWAEKNQREEAQLPDLILRSQQDAQARARKGQG